MLIRDVQIDGKLYVKHELVHMTIIIGDNIVGCVRSYGPEPEYDPADYPEYEEPPKAETVETFHDVFYKDGITAAEAETALWALPEFEEYIDTNPLLDEVLDILTDEQAVVVQDAFPVWKPDTGYSAGDRRRYDGVLYKCLQAHTSQEDHTPDVAASLWARMLNPDPEVIPVWEQPDSTNPYMTGDKVHYPDADGPVYESLIDNNVFSPEAYPQGWQLVQ